MNQIIGFLKNNWTVAILFAAVIFLLMWNVSIQSQKRNSDNSNKNQ